MSSRIAAAAALLSASLASLSSCGTESAPQRRATAGSDSSASLSPPLSPSPSSPSPPPAPGALTPPATSAIPGPRVAATTATPLVLDLPDGTDTPASHRCATRGYRAPAGAKLELRAAQSPGNRALVQVALHNAGTEAVCLYSHIHTHELQNDWLTIRYADGGKYHHISRVISLDDARDKSYPVALLLGPGQTLWYSIDLAQWASRPRNGAEPLPSGSLYAEAALDASREDEVWSGRLTSSPFEIKLP